MMTPVLVNAGASPLGEQRQGSTAAGLPVHQAGCLSPDSPPQLGELSLGSLFGAEWGFEPRSLGWSPGLMPLALPSPLWGVCRLRAVTGKTPMAMNVGSPEPTGAGHTLSGVEADPEPSLPQGRGGGRHRGDCGGGE